MIEIDKRRKFSETNIAELVSKLDDTDSLVHNRACVYATGSYGRLEATEHSDLDLFIVCRLTKKDERSLSRLDGICVMSDLIHATRKQGLPDFDGDGEYLKIYSTSELTKTLGSPHDDALNTFTARLLLLLESNPLLERDQYDLAVKYVISSYWRDYDDHRNDFSPSFILNDILRLWRTFCVNYEARTSNTPDVKKFKRRVKNYKLKHSRMLTCFSSIINTLAVFSQKNTVTPDDFYSIVKRTPIERIQWVLSQNYSAAIDAEIEKVITSYCLFLEKTSIDSKKLIDLLSEKSIHQEYMREANSFGDAIHGALIAVGGETPLMRRLIA